MIEPRREGFQRPIEQIKIRAKAAFFEHTEALERDLFNLGIESLVCESLIESYTDLFGFFETIAQMTSEDIKR